MKVRELANKLQNLKEELQDKDVVVIAKNGMFLPAEVKFEVKYEGDLKRTADNVERVVITW